MKELCDTGYIYVPYFPLLNTSTINLHSLKNLQILQEENSFLCEFDVGDVSFKLCLVSDFDYFKPGVPKFCLRYSSFEKESPLMTDLDYFPTVRLSEQNLGLLSGGEEAHRRCLEVFDNIGENDAKE